MRLKARERGHSCERQPVISPTVANTITVVVSRQGTQEGMGTGTQLHHEARQTAACRLHFYCMTEHVVPSAVVCSVIILENAVMPLQRAPLHYYTLGPPGP